MSRRAKRFNPAQLRDPGGENGGQWISSPGSAAEGVAKDVLKLADRIQLAPDEQLVSSDVIAGDGVDMTFAVVASPRGNHVRIGEILHEDTDKWRAGNLGGTSLLDAEGLAELRSELTAANKKAKNLAAEADRAWEASGPPKDPVLLGDAPVAEGRIFSDWSNIFYNIWLTDDEPTEWRTTLRINPGGEPSSQSDGIGFAPKELAKLLKKLAAIESELSSSSPSKSMPSQTSARTWPRPSQKEGRVDAKSFSRVEIKNADKGEVTAVFATFGVVDADGDVTMPDAFQEGAEAPISQYGHTSWQGALPVGKGRIRTTGKEAIVEGQFFMDTTHGRDAFLTVKQLGRLGQWSYGYDVLDSVPGEFKGRQVRFLKRQLVHEFSPTLIGAGVNTRTLATKGLSPNSSGGSPMGFAYKAAIKPHDTQITSGAWDASAAVKSIAQDASVSDLRSVFAWVDPEADPEMKSSYKFPHHTSVDGPANVRACISGIAALNGARGGTSVPDEDRKGVYDHLAAHLRDNDREPPELRSGSGDGMKFNDEMSLVLYELDNLLDRASEVVALRAKKGRTPLSLGSSELIGWLDADLRRLKFLLTPTEDEAAIEYLRFLRSTLGEQPS